MIESETREFKTSLAELKEGMVPIAAMLNKHGAGELWFGIRPNGQPVGLEIGAKTLRDVSQSVAAHVEPKIYPQIKAKALRGVKCIHVAFSGKEAPYFAYGRAYMRVADEDRQMSAKELEKLILAKNRDVLHFDTQPSTLKLRDLDAGCIERFVHQANLRWNKTENGIRNTLEKLGLVKDGSMLGAAALFFARKPPVQLRCAVFATTTGSTILDQHDFEGDILELIEEAEKYILKNIHIGMRLNGMRREDVPEIAVEALREAIINAFCHRDWFDHESVRVAIYPDRVEIRNPGSLPEGMTIEQLRKGYISRRRNPLVADLLRRVHLVEAWGHGMPLILQKAPQAEFEDVAGIFIARFRRPESVAQETAAKGIGTFEKGSLKSSLKSSLKITELMRQSPEITIPEMAKIIGISDRAVRKHIVNLRTQNRLRRVGPDKGGHWEVLKRTRWPTTLISRAM